MWLLLHVLERGQVGVDGSLDDACRERREEGRGARQLDGCVEFDDGVGGVCAESVAVDEWRGPEVVRMPNAVDGSSAKISSSLSARPVGSSRRIA
jgi:hypothetical protein